MVRRVVGGLAALGVVGGAGAVTYNNDGTAKVTVTTKDGHKESVTIGDGSGPSYSCPSGTHDRLAPIDLRAGRIKITLRHVRQELRVIERRYPNHKAPTKVVVKANRLIKRQSKLVAAYNAAIDEHNRVISSECKPA